MILIGKHKGPTHVPLIMLNGIPLNRVSHFKYLGHVVTEGFKDDMGIIGSGRYASAQVRALQCRSEAYSVPCLLPKFLYGRHVG